MPEPFDTTLEVSAAITDILTALIDTMGVVVAEISVELAEFTRIVSFVISHSVVDLIDDIFDLYSYEWIIVNRNLQRLNNQIDQLIYEQVLSINNRLNVFNVLTNILLSNFEKQLTLIDNSIDPFYNERMFAIYGRIADFSVAINAPPSYLEEKIQNARFFAMAIACNSGLSYYKFLSDWDDGLENLLGRISSNISLYEKNPQWIKLDIEDSLVKPIFSIEINRVRDEKIRLNSISDNVTNLQDLVSTHKLQIDTNSIAIIDLFELKVKPALKVITDNFDNWQKGIYNDRNKLVDDSFVSLFLQIVGVLAEAKRILGLLNYGGDLLLRIDSLTENIRIEQEDKISVVSARAFNRLVPEWQKEVEKHIG